MIHWGLSTAQETIVSDTVFVMEIRDVIDPRMNRYVKLALEEATNVNAKLVIIDMDTPGGALNDAAVLQWSQ